MANPSPRSAAVTAAATLTLLGCTTAFFFWGFFFLNVLNDPPDELGRHFYQVQPITFLVIALVPSAVIGIGIRTGIGLLQLRPWARVLALVWASLALLFSLALIALRPFETFFFPDHFVSATESLRQLMAIALVILMLPASIWWLFLFRMKSVKAQFKAEERVRGTVDTVVTAEV